LLLALMSTLSYADAMQEVITNLGARNGNDLGESSKKDWTNQQMLTDKNSLLFNTTHSIFSQLMMVIEQAQTKTMTEIEIFRLQTEKEKKQIRENATLSVEKCLNSAGKESERVESVHRSEEKELNREIQQIRQRLQEVNSVLETSRNALKTEKRTNAKKMKNIEKTLQQTKAGKAEIETEKASVEKILQTTKANKAKAEAEKTAVDRVLKRTEEHKQKLEAEKSRLYKRVDAVTNDIKEQRTVNSELRREAQSAETKLKKTAEELHDARAENQGLEEDIKEFNKRLHEKNIANNQLVEKTQGLEKMIGNLKAKLKDMQEEKNKLDENLKKSEEFGKGKIVENSMLMKALEEKIEEMHGLEGSVKELKEINEKFEADFLDHMMSYLYVAAAFILVIVYIEGTANTPIQKSKSGKAVMPETGSQAGPGKGRKARARKKKSGSAINAVETINEKFVNQSPFTFVKGPLLLTILSSCVLGFTSFMSSGFMQHNYAWEIIISLNACALAGEYFQMNASVIVSLNACAIVFVLVNNATKLF